MDLIFIDFAAQVESSHQNLLAFKIERDDDAFTVSITINSVRCVQRSEMNDFWQASQVSNSASSNSFCLEANNA